MIFKHKSGDYMINKYVKVELKNGACAIIHVDDINILSASLMDYISNDVLTIYYNNHLSTCDEYTIKNKEDAEEVLREINRHIELRKEKEETKEKMKKWCETCKNISKPCSGIFKAFIGVNICNNYEKKEEELNKENNTCPFKPCSIASYLSDNCSPNETYRNCSQFKKNKDILEKANHTCLPPFTGQDLTKEYIEFITNQYKVSIMKSKIILFYIGAYGKTLVIKSCDGEEIYKDFNSEEDALTVYEDIKKQLNGG